MKIFYYKLLFIIIPVGLLLVLANYLVDPANVYSSGKYVKGIADILLSKHNVDNVSNYDERLLQEQMITRLSGTPDIVVIGSSRIMEIGSDFFPGKTVLNCGVSHADIHDLLAIAGLLDSAGRLPGKIVMNVDPMLIGEGSAGEWKSLSAYHDHFFKKTAMTPAGDAGFSFSIPPRLYSLVSLDYFQKSLSFWASGKNKQYHDVGLDRPQVYGRFADGTVCYSEKYMHPDSVKVAGDAAATAAKTGMPGPDPVKIGYLKTLLDFFQSKKVEVAFVMLPFHYEFYSVANERQHDIFLTSESFFRSLAKERGISVTGGFNARTYGLDESAFYDMYHCSKEAIKEVLITKK